MARSIISVFMVVLLVSVLPSPYVLPVRLRMILQIVGYRSLRLRSV